MPINAHELFHKLFITGVAQQSSYHKPTNMKQVDFLVRDTYIILSDVHFYAHHGLMPQERTVGANFTLQIRLRITPPTQAMQLDQLSDTVNYARVYELLKNEMRQASNLLEHIAYRISKAIYHEFPSVQGIELTIRKDNPPIGGDTGGASFEMNTTRKPTPTGGRR